MPTDRVEFSVDIAGQTYACVRTISGGNLKTQVIEVLGAGSKSDSAQYGPRAHPYAAMEGVARLIAAEIVGDRARRKSAP